MKNIFLLFIFNSFLLNAQILDQGDTYAVVVGISDYQDEDIPDLRFADKDALEFASFLQSPAGGSLDEDHLKVLINEKATVAQFAIALDWLWEVVKEDDRAIIYFSGHGDVERKSLTQPGFLLCWDAPSKIYLAGGTLALPMFQEVISTLSVQNKAKVIVIMDACRSGKLSGSPVGGAQLTNANLAKQYANEIKILSCQPDEYSIEGMQWGGGRGAFSYHLLEGLYGMADSNEDLNINLKEINRYLEDRVSLEVAPQSQNPMTIGSKTEKLTDVFPEILEQLKEGKKKQLQLFAATEARGIEEDVLAKVDSNIVEMYFAFKKSLSDKRFLYTEAGRPENDFAEFYYEKLIKEPGLKQLHSSMRRNYAAALQDDAQQVMNDWMKTDIDKIKTPLNEFKEKIKRFPQYLDRAAELLGNDHYMYTTLLARKYFFEGYIININSVESNPETGRKALSSFRKALKLQPEMPQVYWQISRVFLLKLSQPDSAMVYTEKAIEQYPSWITPYTDLAFSLSLHYQQFDRAKLYLDKAMKIDSTSAKIWNAYAVFNYFKGNKQDAEKCLRKVIQYDSTNVQAYYNLGNIKMNDRQYPKAEKYFLKAVQVDSTDYTAAHNLGTLYVQTKQFLEAEKHLKRAIQMNPKYIDSYLNLGELYQWTNRWEESEEIVKRALELDSTDALVFAVLGNAYSHIPGKIDQAEEMLKKALHMAPEIYYTYVYLAKWSLNKGLKEQSWEYLEQGLEKGIASGNLKEVDLQESLDYRGMREEPRWKEVIEKFFPKELKK